MQRRFAFISVMLLLVLVTLCGCADRSEGGMSLHFDDVPASEVWGEAIYRLSDEGYFVGRGEGRFDPLSPLTRAEAAVLMIRAQFGASYTPDGNIVEWWTPWVEKAVAQGFMGEPIDPAAPATRADIATLLWLMRE
jgi:hypothetical protein